MSLFSQFHNSHSTNLRSKDTKTFENTIVCAIIEADNNKKYFNFAAGKLTAGNHD